MPRIICLIGSTRYYLYFIQIMHKLSLYGHIVLLPGVFNNAFNVKIEETQAARLFELQLRKIEMSDSVVVINPNGFIPPAVRKQIYHARRIGKIVCFLKPEINENVPELPII